MLAQLKPSAILIEGPCNFDPLIPLITDSQTKTPVAIVSVDEREVGDSDTKRRVVSYFPFCAHSPEYVALRYAHDNGVPASFIDLPASDRDYNGLNDTDAHILIDERAFTSSDYVRALAHNFGCRDGNEVWDHLFETRLHQTDWRAFFQDVGLYCSHMREGTTQASMEADGTLAREAQMRALIAATQTKVSGDIVVIVGGFHASALVGEHAPRKVKTKAKPKGAANAYLIRYGNRQLNALTGYSAGLPLPGYYQGLWDQRSKTPDDQMFSAYAHDLVLAFSAHLKIALPAHAPPLPVITSTLENAHQLAALRGRPGPLRDDILDAMRSTLLKGEEDGEGAPVLQELLAWMTGSAIGNVPPSAGSPPLVEAVRTKAKSLGFSVDDGQRRNRDLDIYRKDRHRAASQFLHGLAFIEAGFGHRVSGPDFSVGVDLDRLVEQWVVTWSPMVEARLIELSADGDDLETVLAAVVLRRLEALRTKGEGNNATAAIKLFARACQAGIADKAVTILPFIADEITSDPDMATVSSALRELVHLWRGGRSAGIEDRGPIESLIQTAWRRALFLLPNIVDAGDDRVAHALDGLVTLRETVALAGDGLTIIDPTHFSEAVQDLLTRETHPTIGGAVCAMAFLSGLVDDAYLATRAAGELNGAYVIAQSRVAFLRGVLAVSRELLWAVPALIDTMDDILNTSEAADFTELLPHLRLTFSALDPRDIDRLAHIIADKYATNAGALTAGFEVSEFEQAQNRALDDRLMALMREGGLA
jgi:hypothetical protein